MMMNVRISNELVTFTFPFGSSPNRQTSHVMDLPDISTYFIIVFLGFLIPGTELNTSCLRDEYYSESTNKCLPCPTKCSPSQTKGCNTTCIKCPLHHYMDNVTGTCQRCDELCHQAEVSGTEKRCQELCPVERPVELKHEETDTNLTEPLANSWKPPRSSSNGRSPLPVVAVTFLVAICLLAVVGIVAMMDGHRKLNKYLCIKSVTEDVTLDEDNSYPFSVDTSEV